MNRKVLPLLVGIIVFGVVGVARAQQFAFSFDGPDEVLVPPGETTQFEIVAVLRASDVQDLTALEAWQFSVAVEGGVIVGATTEGTFAEFGVDPEEPDPEGPDDQDQDAEAEVAGGGGGVSLEPGMARASIAFPEGLADHGGGAIPYVAPDR